LEAAEEAKGGAVKLRGRVALQVAGRCREERGINPGIPGSSWVMGAAEEWEVKLIMRGNENRVEGLYEKGMV